MTTIQNELGKKSEETISSFLHKKHFWVYVFPKKMEGQPFDIIACKNNEIWMLDVKHLESSKVSFPIYRIEPNQISSMIYARTFANIENLGFILDWEKDKTAFFFLRLDKVLELRKKNIKSIKIIELERWEKTNEDDNK